MSHKVYIEGYIIIDEAEGETHAKHEAMSKLSVGGCYDHDFRVRTVEEICDLCHGEGEIPSDVDDGEGHIMRGAGYPIKCPECAMDKDQGSLLT